MRLTNHHNLPDSLVEAVRYDDYDSGGADATATSLIQPPQMAHLFRLHQEDIEVDAADQIYRLLGSCAHVVLDRASVDNALQEERMSIRVAGWTISGKTDIYHQRLKPKLNLIQDYKVTSVWSFKLGDKPEWIQQLNIYAAILRENGWPVDRLEIVAILRDWQKRRVREDGYPPAPALLKQIPLWPHEQAMAYIEERVAAHKLAKEKGLYPPCTDEERWYSGDKWAVKKNQNKRAVKLFDSESEAKIWAQALDTTKKDHYWVEHRPGEDKRCEGYCDVARWCKQHQQSKNGNG